MKPSAEENNATERTSALRLPPSAFLFLVIWFLLLLAGRSAMFRDPGVFWHMADGEKILADGRLIRDDSYSFTREGRAWISDQWLAEVGMAAIHRLAGWDGLLLMAATLLAGLYAWLGGRLLRGGLHVLPAVLILSVALLAGAPQFHVRPLLATLVLLGATFALLVDVEAGRRRFRILWWLVPLFVLWTNLHGGVLGGLGTVALCVGGWCLAAVCRNDKDAFLPFTGRDNTVILSAAKNLVCAAIPHKILRCAQNDGFLFFFTSIFLLLALILTTLCNPYGLALPREWLETLMMPLPSIIEEHAPLNFAEPVGWGVAVLAAFYLAVLLGVLPQRCWGDSCTATLENNCRANPDKNLPPTALTPGPSPVGRARGEGEANGLISPLRIVWLLPLAWLVLAVLRVRNAPLFAITAVIAAADMLPYSRVGRWLERRGMFMREPLHTLHALRPLSLHRFLPALLPMLVVAGAALLQLAGVHCPVVGRGWARFDETVWPMKLLPEIEEINRLSPKGERIFNDMRFGGFLIYHAPRLRIFIDDRCPLYGTEFLTAYQRAQSEEPAQLDRWREEYGFRHALVESGGRFDGYLSTAEGWKLVERARAAALYEHKP